MSNLARPPAPSESPLTSLTGVVDRQRSPHDLLDDLRAARTGAAPLAGLAPTTYARTHAAFELLSDQRRLITEHLAARLAARRSGAVSVLSVGCGDGALDAPLAASLADVRPERSVRYVGVDPFAGSTHAFATALGGLRRGSLSVETHTSTFEDLEVRGRFDVVTCVHSMYYVRDVAETLRAAHDLLRPGGELLVLSAPRAELNALVEVLAPPLEDHEQWFSDDVARGLEKAGLAADATLTLDAGFDAAGSSDEVLDFTVQAQLTPDLRSLVRAYLDAVSVPAPAEGHGRRVPHPVDVYRVVRAA